eukprot:gnl/MRDRNA2_/MRDRNA2_90471_c0_seq1.p1 gnl/MRDRNA2_/MRDRNA2_90471_c0~~gnl/MRDRNA2_/MRDRNA2_90471_c0_seq1.p1  ORF type:complete len:541 (+),score=130.09 gnl/MRDRNA2_/MRDRNA2_90471_c0_seq1:134-1756(+)
MDEVDGSDSDGPDEESEEEKEDEEIEVTPEDPATLSEAFVPQEECERTTADPLDDEQHDTALNVSEQGPHESSSKGEKCELSTDILLDDGEHHQAPATEGISEDAEPSQTDSTAGLVGVCERIVSDAAAEMTEALRAESVSPRTTASSATKAHVDHGAAVPKTRATTRATVKFDSATAETHRPSTRGESDRARLGAKSMPTRSRKSEGKAEVPARKTEVAKSDRKSVSTQGQKSTSLGRPSTSHTSLASPRPSTLRKSLASPRPSTLHTSAAPPASPRASHALSQAAPASPQSPKPQHSRGTNKSEAAVTLRSLLLQVDPEEVEGVPEDFPLEKDLGAGKMKKLIERLEKFIKPETQHAEMPLSPKSMPLSESRKRIVPLGSSVETYRKTSVTCNEVFEKAEALVEAQPPERIEEIQEEAYAALQELTNYTHQVQDDISATTDKNEETKRRMDEVAGEFRHMREALRSNRVQLKQMQEDIQTLQKDTKKAMTESIEQLKERTRKIMSQLGEETKSMARQSQRPQVDGRAKSNTRRRRSNQ